MPKGAIRTSSKSSGTAYMKTPLPSKRVVGVFSISGPPLKILTLENALGEIPCPNDQASGFQDHLHPRLTHARDFPANCQIWKVP